MVQSNRQFVRALLSASMVVVATAGWSQSITWLGTLGGNRSSANGVSADGSVVVGLATAAGNRERAFRWTAATGMQDLGTFGGDFGVAHDVSADGSVVVGWADTGPPQARRAFRWTAATGMQDLGTLGGSSSWATGVSADGSVVVGYALTPSDIRAFRWTAATGMQDIGTLGGFRSWANGVSADGSVVVGRSFTATMETRAFRWTASGGMQNLGTFPGGGYSEAHSASSEGSVVVGLAYHGSGAGRASRWTASGEIQHLGTLGGWNSEALGVSADGSVVVGWSDTPLQVRRAFRWTPARGIQDLNVLYASLLPPGFYLVTANAVSANGRYIVGEGETPTRMEAFLLDTLETFRPQGFTLLRGFVRSGGLSDLFQSDNQYLRLIPGFVLNQLEAPIQMVVYSTAPVTQPHQVTLVWEVAGNVPNIEERVELYNFYTGQWDLVSQQVITQQDTRHEVSLSHPGYVSPLREVQARFSYRALGLVLLYPWEVRLDETSFAVIR